MPSSSGERRRTSRSSGGGRSLEEPSGTQPPSRSAMTRPAWASASSRCCVAEQVRLRRRRRARTPSPTAAAAGPGRARQSARPAGARPGRPSSAIATFSRCRSRRTGGRFGRRRRAGRTCSSSSRAARRRVVRVLQARDSSRPRAPRAARSAQARSRHPADVDPSAHSTAPALGASAAASSEMSVGLARAVRPDEAIVSPRRNSTSSGASACRFPKLLARPRARTRTLDAGAPFQ